MPTQRERYNTYLKSTHWASLRSRQLQTYSLCQACGASARLHVHHIRYRNLVDCDLGDLATLCDNCHSDLHATIAATGWDVSSVERIVRMLALARRHTHFDRWRQKWEGRVQKTKRQTKKQTNLSRTKRLAERAVKRAERQAERKRTKPHGEQRHLAKAVRRLLEQYGMHCESCDHIDLLIKRLEELKNGWKRERSFFMPTPILNIPSLIANLSAADNEPF